MTRRTRDKPDCEGLWLHKPYEESHPFAVDVFESADGSLYTQVESLTIRVCNLIGQWQGPIEWEE